MNRGEEFLRAYQDERARQKEDAQYHNWDAAGLMVLGVVAVLILVLVLL